MEAQFFRSFGHLVEGSDSLMAVGSGDLPKRRPGAALQITGRPGAALQGKTL